MIKKNVFMKNSRLTKIILLFCSITIPIILFELLLHILCPCLLVGIYLRKPYLTKVFRPAPEIMPGIFGTSKFILNSCGIRGDELNSKHTRRILVIGGSSAECLYLDQSEAWPYLLQKKLNQNLGRDEAWVGNAGMSGKNTGDHLKLIKYFPLKRFKIDTIIVLTGINDLSSRLSLDKEYYSKEEEMTFFKKIFIWRLLRQIQKPPIALGVFKIQDDYGKILQIWRSHRQSAARIIDSLPDLTSALAEYAHNINAIIDTAKKNNIRIIFSTQPTLWRASLPEELKKLLWLGGVGEFQDNPGCAYYSVEALVAGMKMYNDSLLAVCRERNVECIDLASLLPQDTSIFYDDCHFNENGSIMVSEIIAQYLLKYYHFGK